MVGSVVEGGHRAGPVAGAYPQPGGQGELSACEGAGKGREDNEQVRRAGKQRHQIRQDEQHKHLERLQGDKRASGRAFVRPAGEPCSPRQPEHEQTYHQADVAIHIPEVRLVAVDDQHLGGQTEHPGSDDRKAARPRRSTPGPQDEAK